MRRILVLALSVCGLCSCGVLPPASPSVIQHDLGSGFVRLLREPLGLRAVTVSASPMLAGLAMHYRTADQPTVRGIYAFNRWAAPPAVLVEQAAVRLLPLDPGGRCRLSIVMADFILEVDAAGRGEAVIASNLRLTRDDRPAVLTRSLDVRVPVAAVQPALAAQGLREAVGVLADQTADWLGGDPRGFCRD
ncbi:MAG: hypothetical protein IPO35_04015 [Uliginosibacterium sp.]|jgi:hypothetical protein|nr:hypothetical protein [Uliginosibacterium sp.]MBK9614709.1 hypothetical protein [Uliginosibacterium sp.]